jgi:cell pole-organizing protein PopZ
MEEILASIRRIISEDDKPAEEAEAPAEAAVAVAPPPPQAVAPPPPPPEPAPQAPVAEAPPAAPVEADEEEDVLELTEPAPVATETHGDLDVFTPRTPPPRPAPPPAPERAPSHAAYDEDPDDDSLLSDGPEDAVLSHFGRLSQTIAMPKSARTLEDVVRELLRPLLTDWLDEHLPRIVEEKVQAEVERIARRRS